MTEQRVLITGAAGQDGTILARKLEGEGASVFGVIKPGTSLKRLQSYSPGTTIIEIDLSDTAGLKNLIGDVRPTQLFNFGGFTAPAESWTREEEVRAINVDAVRVILETAHRMDASSRFLQASSSHIFEGTDRSPQDETFELTPVSPYARSKAEALQIVRQMRTDRGYFAVSAILYNHESPLRTENFVTRKVSRAVARIAAGQQTTLELGDVEVARDWGWAPDYVRAMRMMMLADHPQDFVLATGISHRLSFFVEKAFAAAGISQWRDLVVTEGSDRPVDTNKMVGDSRRAYRELGWRHTVDFDSMSAAMVAYDQALLKDPDLLWTDF